MRFDKNAFFGNFKQHLDHTRKLAIAGKTDNAVDTVRVFKAVDFACESQPQFFPENGESFWNGEGMREFLCDYTFHSEDHRVLLALESEWGTCASPKQTLRKVMTDFKKVVNMAAPIKVMVFAYTDESNEKNCLEAMQSLIQQWPQDAVGTLLAISCPWNDEMHSESVGGYSWENDNWANI